MGLGLVCEVSVLWLARALLAGACQPKVRRGRVHGQFAIAVLLAWEYTSVLERTQSRDPASYYAHPRKTHTRAHQRGAVAEPPSQTYPRPRARLGHHHAKTRLGSLKRGESQLAAAHETAPPRTNLAAADAAAAVMP